MTPFSWVIITGFALAIIGLVSWILIDKAFNHLPQYRTPKYGISFYYKIEPIGLREVDTAIDILIVLLRELYPRTSLALIQKILKQTNVKICDDNETNLYVEVDQSIESAGKKFKVIDDSIYVLRNGVQRGNSLWIRNIDSDIFKTAFIHALMHWILQGTGTIPSADPKHELIQLWEDGIVGKVLKEFR